MRGYDEGTVVGVGLGGLIVTQQQIIREVWDPGREDDTRNLRVAIKGLRQKIEPDPRARKNSGVRENVRRLTGQHLAGTCPCVLSYQYT